MEYTFRGKVTLEDYIQFNKFHIKQRPMTILTLLYIILIALMTLDIFHNFDIEEVSILLDDLYLGELEFNDIILLLHYIAHYTIIPIIFLSLPIIFFKIFLPKFYMKIYFSDKFIQEFTEYKINQEEIFIVSKSANATLNKDNIFKIKYDNTSIYLYISMIQAYIIKNHFFDNIHEFEKAAKFIKEHYG